MYDAYLRFNRTIQLTADFKTWCERNLSPDDNWNETIYQFIKQFAALFTEKQFAALLRSHPNLVIPVVIQKEAVFQTSTSSIPVTLIARIDYLTSDLNGTELTTTLNVEFSIYTRYEAYAFVPGDQYICYEVDDDGVFHDRNF